MATNPLGPGTVNLTTNVKVAVRAALGRFAHHLDISRGELCRRLLAAGAHIARAFRIAQRERREATLLETRLRGILADGKVTDAEVIELREECVPLSTGIAHGAAGLVRELSLAEVVPFNRTAEQSTS